MFCTGTSLWSVPSQVVERVKVLELSGIPRACQDPVEELVRDYTWGAHLWYQADTGMLGGFGSVFETNMLWVCPFRTEMQCGVSGLEGQTSS